MFKAQQKGNNGSDTSLNSSNIHENDCVNNDGSAFVFFECLFEEESNNSVKPVIKMGKKLLFVKIDVLMWLVLFLILMLQCY